MNIPVAGQDYTVPDPLQVTFIAFTPNTLHCVTIDILDDTVLEEQHYFIVIITDVGPFAMIETPSVSAVVIIDDESEEHVLFV